MEISLFEPKPEIQKEFYVEKPIKLEAKGKYDELASFVSDLSALPRIVTIDDIRLQPEQQEKDKKKGSKKEVPRLIMEATIRTYRYVDENVEEEEV